MKMGIRFRKRLKVAPGVYVNLSKSGFSTTARLVKGVSLNMGKDGTFINTSIPGTGIYSRERLNWSQNNATKSIMPNDDMGKFNTGCLWLTIILVLMLSLGIFKAVGNQDSMLVVVCSLLLFALLITWLIPDKTRQSDYNYYEEELKKTRRIMHGLTDNELEKRKILSSYADCLDIELQIDLEEKIIQGLTVKKKKKFQKLIDEHTAKCISLKTELEKKRYDCCEGLSEEIIDSYKELCLSYEELKKSEGLLYRGAKGANIELNYGVFDYLKCLVDVPAFANINGDIVFFYPKFVIKSSSNTEFQVIPMDCVTLETSIIDVTTRNKAYSDCEDVSYEFLYTTKDGSPDMRYKDNPLIKTMKMNVIRLSFMDEDILVSNKKLCDEFVEKFKHHINFFQSEEDNNDVNVVNVAEKTIILQDADPLLKEAALLIFNHGGGSASLIQRDFMIGYGRAIKIINQLEEIGIIGAFNGSASRKVLIKSRVELAKIFERTVCPENNAFNAFNEESEEISNNNEQKRKSVGLSQLDNLIGLESVKHEVRTMYNFVKIQISREQNGLKKSNMTYHCVFTGNPGTGKTTVARILAKIYKDLGVLKKGHLVETDRSGLVAEYVGQTAVKTNKIIDSALDGVLFIDEAYSLAVDGSDYGSEAIATLLKRMEDNRDRLIVILAGYTNEMKTFINSNPGLESRFSKYIDFPDYNADELFQILLSYSKKQDYLINKDAYEKLKVFIADTLAHKDSNWGNARWVRNVFEQILSRQANRLASMSEPTKEQLREITIEDCP